MCQNTTTSPHAPQGCGCNHGHGAGTTKPASHDLDFPPVPFPSTDVLKVVGEIGLRLLVSYHYDLIRRSEISHLFPGDEKHFAMAVKKSADFVVETCGGPTLYSEHRGNECMRTRHLPYLIDEDARDVWLDCLWRAFDGADIPPAARRELWDWLEPMSIRMINRRTLRGHRRQNRAACGGEIRMRSRGAPCVGDNASSAQEPRQ